MLGGSAWPSGPRFTEVEIQSTEYEVLVAAHLLRNSQFAAQYAPIMNGAANSFFGRHELRALVQHGLDYFRSKGELLPSPCLKADVALLAHPDAHPASYDRYIDMIFGVTLEGERHIRDSLLAEIQTRMLDALEENRAEVVAEHGLSRYMEAIREVVSLRDATGERRVSGLLEDLEATSQRPSRVIPTGFAPLDYCLDWGGLGPGEVLLWDAAFNVGKTQLLHHQVRTAALEHGHRSAVVSLETSMRNTKLRILRGAMGWTKDQMAKDKAGFQRLVNERFEDAPIHVIYAPAEGTYTLTALENDLDRIAQREGDPVKFVARDYGQLMVRELDAWTEVRKTYLRFYAMLRRLGIAGADAAQQNRQGQITYHNLLMDADVGVEVREDAPGADVGVLECRIRRNREGPKGKTFTLVVDRTTGQVRAPTTTPRDLDDDE